MTIIFPLASIDFLNLNLVANINTLLAIYNMKNIVDFVNFIELNKKILFFRKPLGMIRKPVLALNKIV
jgi:hypothetical protein